MPYAQVEHSFRLEPGAQPSALYNVSGATAPAAIRPSSVITTEKALLDSSRPLPQVPETFGSAARTCFIEAASPPGPSELDPSAFGPPGVDWSADEKSPLATTTLDQPLPTILVSSCAALAFCSASAFFFAASELSIDGAVSSVTFVPLGGLN